MAYDDQIYPNFLTIIEKTTYRQKQDPSYWLVT
jgi:hypothetical protein